MDPILTKLIAELPGLGLMAAFAWALLRMVAADLKQISVILDRIDQRTEHCHYHDRSISPSWLSHASEQSSPE